MEKQFEITDDLIASQGQRFLNSIIDTIAYYIVLIGFGIFLGFMAELLDSPALLDWLSNIDKLTDILITVTVTSAYFFLFETASATTLGKLITRTVVVDIHGNKPDTAQLLRRTFSRLIPLDAFSFLSTPSRGWHDKLSDTYVVRKNDLQEAKNIFYSLEQIGSETETETPR